MQPSVGARVSTHHFHRRPDVSLSADRRGPLNTLVAAFLVTPLSHDHVVHSWCSGSQVGWTEQSASGFLDLRGLSSVPIRAKMYTVSTYRINS